MSKRAVCYNFDMNEKPELAEQNDWPIFKWLFISTAVYFLSTGPVLAIYKRSGSDPLNPQSAFESFSALWIFFGYGPIWSTCQFFWPLKVVMDAYIQAWFWLLGA